MIKEDYVYVGIDLHKETHTEVIINCYNKLGEITFANRPVDFPKLVTKVKKSNADGKTVVFGLENAYGYGRPTTLYFWEHYPSKKYLEGKTVVDLREELVPVSHNKCSTKTCDKILDAVSGDKVKNNDFQDARDMVTLSIVSDLQHYDKQLAEVDKM